MGDSNSVVEEREDLVESKVVELETKEDEEVKVEVVEEEKEVVEEEKEVVEEEKEIVMPFYFSLPWILLNLFLIGSLLSTIMFGLGRGKFKAGEYKTADTYKIWGFALLIIGFIVTLVLLARINSMDTYY